MSKCNSSVKSTKLILQEDTYGAIYKMKFYEFQKYLSIRNHGLIEVYTLASKKWWDKLPSDIQNTLGQVFSEAERVTWERAQEIDHQAIKAMKAAGLKFVKILPRERERFRKATQSAKNVYIKRIGENGKNSLKCLKRTSLPIQSRHTSFLETLGRFCGHSVFTTPL